MAVGRQRGRNARGGLQWHDSGVRGSDNGVREKGRYGNGNGMILDGYEKRED